MDATSDVREPVAHAPLTIIDVTREAAVSGLADQWRDRCVLIKCGRVRQSLSLVRREEPRQLLLR
jgi:hypothetical protein